MKMRPAVGRFSPAISDSNVVLPEPLGPRMVTNSPCATQGPPRRPRRRRSACSRLRGGCRSSQRRHGAIGGRQRLVDDRIVMRRRQEPLAGLVDADALLLQRTMEGEHTVAVAGVRLAIVARRRAGGEEDLEDRRQPRASAGGDAWRPVPPAPASVARRALLEVAVDRAVVALQLVEAPQGLRPCSGRCRCRCRRASRPCPVCP